jgi:hypothetical protein
MFLEVRLLIISCAYNAIKRILGEELIGKTFPRCHGCGVFDPTWLAYLCTLHLPIKGQESRRASLVPIRPIVRKSTIV